MTRLHMYVATAALAFFAPVPSYAQYNIAGVSVSCSDFRDVPVVLLSNPLLPDVGRAVIDPSGRPVIMLNPQILVYQSTEMQLFWFAHECAHHVLGHIIQFSAANESMADCWAVITGKRQGWFPPQAFQHLVEVLGSSPGSIWGHLPGPARIQNMMNCYASQ